MNRALARKREKIAGPKGIGSPAESSAVSGLLAGKSGASYNAISSESGL